MLTSNGKMTPRTTPATSPLSPAPIAAAPSSRTRRGALPASGISPRTTALDQADLPGSSRRRCYAWRPPCGGSCAGREAASAVRSHPASFTDSFQPARPASAGRLPNRRHRARRAPSRAPTGPPSFPRQFACIVASRSHPSPCAAIDSRQQIQPKRLPKREQRDVHWAWRRIVSGGGAGQDCKINHVSRSTADHRAIA